MLLAAIQLWPLAGPGKLPQNLDLMLQYAPNATYLARSLAEGRLPLWNPYLGGGMPFAADPGTGTLYLPNWPLLLTLPLDSAIRAILWAHLIWAALGVYAYARLALRVGPLPSWIGAATFALSTWLPTLSGMPVVLTTVSWLPWIMLLGDRAASRAGLWLAGLALAGALQVVAGWPAGAYLTWLALGITTLVRYPRVNGLVRVGFGGMVAALLAGALIVPAGELVLESNYADTRPLDQVARDGYLTLLSWFRPASGHGTLESSQLYLGMAPVLLAVAGAAFGRRREALALGTLALFAVLVAAGVNGPLFAALYHWLPGFRIVYLPARLGVVGSFALAGLAALGAERLTRRPWGRLQPIVVGSISALLVGGILLQFLQAEGYDAFRRLLTNVGRFAEGPYLSREQELHYAVFGALAFAVLCLAGRVPRNWALGAVAGLVAADLALAQARSQPQAFEPVSWFGAAVQAGRAQASQLGAERLAGLQWHGNQHFLNRFPAGASPALLPPNLALLASVRDAQAYNPLLLRRSVEYFAEINRGLTDDHWLWLSDYDSPRVDRLAVRRVLAAGGEWRVTERLLASELKLAPHATQVLDVSRQRSRPRRLRVVSYLGEGTDLAQGAPAFEILLVDESDSEQRFVLQAGVGTAEWAYDRPDVRTAVRHRQAPVALRTRLVDPVGGAYDVFEYTAVLDLPVPLALREIWLRSLTGGATVYVQQLWADESRTPSFSVSPDGIENLEARPRFSLGGGDVTVVVDEPERIVVRTASPSSGTLTIADTYYPGWRASVDGKAVDVAPVERLFRGVQVPAGEHQIEMLYAPLSLQIGLWSSGVGVLICALVAGIGAFRRPRGPHRLRRLPSRS